MRTKEQRAEQSERRRADRYARHPTLALWSLVRGIIAWVAVAAICVWQVLTVWDFVIARHDGGKHPILHCLSALALTAGLVLIWQKRAGPVMKYDLSKRWYVWRIVTGHHVRLPR